MSSNDILKQYPSSFLENTTVYNQPSTSKAHTFPSQLPAFLRNTKDVSELVPWLYLKGAYSALNESTVNTILGQPMRGLSQSSMVRLKKQWDEEYQEWKTQSLHGKEYLYFWMDGIYFNVPSNGNRQSVYIIIATAYDGSKDLVLIEEGQKDSVLRWTEVFQQLKDRGLEKGPKLAIGDSDLGAWEALKNVFPETQIQYCWLHQLENILDNTPRTSQKKVRETLDAISKAENRESALQKYDQLLALAAENFPKYKEEIKINKDFLLTFFDFPKDHWYHIRSTNSIESIFGSLRAKSSRAKKSQKPASGCATMAFKLATSAQKQWRRIRGYEAAPEATFGEESPSGHTERMA